MGYMRYMGSSEGCAWLGFAEQCSGPWKPELSAGLLLAACGYPRTTFWADVFRHASRPSFAAPAAGQPPPPVASCPSCAGEVASLWPHRAARRTKVIDIVSRCAIPVADSPICVWHLAPAWQVGAMHHENNGC